MREEVGKRKSTISSKRVDLSRCGGNIAYSSTELHNHDHDCHSCCSPDRTCSVEKDLDEGEPCLVVFEDFGDIPDAEYVGYYHDEAG